MTLHQMCVDFATKYPTPADHPNGGPNTWDQECGTVMSRMCLAYGKEPTGDVHSAYHVAMRSKIVSLDWRKAVPGDFHFWDIAGPENGHVSLDVNGGGKGSFMGNWRAHVIPGAVALGFLDVDDYTRLSGARYLGFSRKYANGYVNVPKPKPAGTKPDLIQKEIANMATGIVFKGKSSSTVWWQERPNTPFVGLDADTYRALLAAGIKRGPDVDDKDMTALLRRWGTSDRPTGSGAHGVAYRNSETNSIYWQEKPGTPLIGLNPVEWATLRQNGLLYVDYTTAELAPLLK